MLTARAIALENRFTVCNEARVHGFSLRLDSEESIVVFPNVNIQETPSRVRSTAHVARVAMLLFKMSIELLRRSHLLLATENAAVEKRSVFVAIFACRGTGVGVASIRITVRSLILNKYDAQLRS